MTAHLLSRLHRALVAIVLVPVLLYRVIVSPLKRVPTCRFVPTCSQYAIDAVKHRGIFVGVGLAAWRVARCHPLCQGGFDPFPGLHREHG